MRMLFRGWKREVTPHPHPVTPVKSRGNIYSPGKEGETLTWAEPFKAYGKVNGLALSGSFLVEFSFEVQELESWLGQYVKAHPAAACRLLARMQAEATIRLAESTNASNAPDK